MPRESVHAPVGNDAQTPVRVLEVVRSLASGGMENQLVALINRLDPSRHHFEVCCLREPGVNAEKLNPGIAVHCFHKPEGFRWQSVRDLRSLLACGFDVVHTHNLGSLIYATLATRGGRQCAIFHGEHAQLAPDELQWKKMLQRRLLFPLCKAVHTVSNSQRDELLRLRFRHPQLTAIVNGVNTSHYRPIENPADRTQLRTSLNLGDSEAFIIGIVGRFGDFKRHRELITAFEKLAAAQPKARLVIIGDGGPLKKSVLTQIEFSPAKEHIRWVGYHSDPLDYYQSLDLLAVPSTNEGLSNATLEAMATGLPVLTHQSCGAEEILGTTPCGWIRDLRNIEAIEAELTRIIALPFETRQSIGRAARRRVEENFSWNGMADAYSRWLHACAGRRSFPPNS